MMTHLCVCACARVCVRECVTHREQEDLWGKSRDHPTVHRPKEQPKDTSQKRNDQETLSLRHTTHQQGRARLGHSTGQVKLKGQVQLRRQGRTATGNKL